MPPFMNYFLEQRNLKGLANYVTCVSESYTGHLQPSQIYKVTKTPSCIFNAHSILLLSVSNSFHVLPISGVRNSTFEILESLEAKCFFFLFVKKKQGTLQNKPKIKVKGRTTMNYRKHNSLFTFFRGTC